jgi:hypothetical protein
MKLRWFMICLSLTGCIRARVPVGQCLFSEGTIIRIVSVGVNSYELYITQGFGEKTTKVMPHGYIDGFHLEPWEDIDCPKDKDWRKYRE